MRTLAILLSFVAAVASAQRRPEPARAAQLVRLANAYLASGDRGSAIGTFREAIQVDPRAAAAYEGLGRAYRQRGSLDDARDVLEAGLRRAPDHGPLYLELAATLVEMGDLAQAAAVLRERVERAPQDAEAVARLAELAHRRGAWNEALAAQRRTIAISQEGLLSEAVGREAQRFEAALRLLASPLDPVSAPRACDGSAVRRALARCDR